VPPKNKECSYEEEARNRAGEGPDIGVFFAQPNSTPLNREKAAGNLAENTAGKIIGQVPNLGPGSWKVQVVTRYSGGSAPLKTPRTIEFAHVLTVS
jgi:hypothetical protein